MPSHHFASFDQVIQRNSSTANGIILGESIPINNGDDENIVGTSVRECERLVEGRIQRLFMGMRFSFIMGDRYFYKRI